MACSKRGSPHHFTRCLHGAPQQRDGVCVPFSSAITLAMAVAAIALDALTLFNFSRAAPSSHVQSQSFVAVTSM